MDRGQFSLEVRVFKDKMRDMISGIIAFEDWTIDNNVDIDQKGFEVEAAIWSERLSRLLLGRSTQGVPI